MSLSGKIIFLAPGFSLSSSDGLQSHFICYLHKGLIWAGAKKMFSDASWPQAFSLPRMCPLKLSGCPWQTRAIWLMCPWVKGVSEQCCRRGNYSCFSRELSGVGTPLGWLHGDSLGTSQGARWKRRLRLPCSHSSVASLCEQRDCGSHEPCVVRSDRREVSTAHLC